MNKLEQKCWSLTWAMAKNTAASKSTLFKAPGCANNLPSVLTGNCGSPALGVDCPKAKPTSEAHRSCFRQTRQPLKQLLHMAQTPA